MDFSLFCPTSVEEAVRIQSENCGTYLAGGTVLLVNRHNGKEIGSTLISLDGISELRRIELTDDALLVGAGVTFDEIEQSDLVREHAHALWQAAREVGGPQIRHRATVGGNIAAASPAADSVTPLLALNASIQVVGLNGERLLPLDGFFLGRMKTILKPDELITSVVIPLGSKSVFAKVGKRNALSVSCLNMAVAKDHGNIRVAVGAAAPEARLCHETSRLLSADINALDEACRVILTEISPIDDRWGTASYRKLVCQNLLKELMRQLKEESL